jgi:formyltetrahydrofolate synthetase
MTTKKPRTSRTPKLLSTEPKLSKKVLSNITSLSNYNSNKPLNQHMITLVQNMYKNRDITNFKTAATALDLLTSKNDFNKFKTTLTKITKLIDKKTTKININKDIKQQKKEVTVK